MRTQKRIRAYVFKNVTAKLREVGREERKKEVWKMADWCRKNWKERKCKAMQIQEKKWKEVD